MFKLIDGWFSILIIIGMCLERIVFLEYVHWNECNYHEHLKIRLISYAVIEFKNETKPSPSMDFKKEIQLIRSL